MVVVVDVRLAQVFLFDVLVRRVRVLDLRVVVEMLVGRYEVLDRVCVWTVGVVGDVGMSVTVKEVFMPVQDEALDEDWRDRYLSGGRLFRHCVPPRAVRALEVPLLEKRAGRGPGRQPRVP